MSHAPKTMREANPGIRNNPKTLAQYEKLIGNMAFRSARRAQSVGLPMDKEDFAQELRIKFLHTVKAWDENKNASFINLFTMAGWRMVNNIFVAHERRGQTGPDLRMDKSDEDKDGLHELVKCSGAGPEETALLADSIDAIRGRLKGDTLAIFNILLDPPALVVDQFLLKIRGAEIDRELGGGSRSYPEINIRFLCTLFGLSQLRTAQVKYDFDRLFKIIGSI